MTNGQYHYDRNSIALILYTQPDGHEQPIRYGLERPFSREGVQGLYEKIAYLVLTKPKVTVTWRDVTYTITPEVITHNCERGLHCPQIEGRKIAS